MRTSLCARKAYSLPRSRKPARAEIGIVGRRIACLLQANSPDRTCFLLSSRAAARRGICFSCSRSAHRRRAFAQQTLTVYLSFRGAVRRGICFAFREVESFFSIRRSALLSIDRRGAQEPA